MRRKIKHSKRYKDYPKNVPKKLLQLFFSDCKILSTGILSVSKLATLRNVNSGTISALLNDGIEPRDIATRVRLYLSPTSFCKTCGHKIKQMKTTIKRIEPEYMKDWKRLPTDERQKVIKEYLKWKK